MTKWWSANLTNRLIFASRHPGYALGSVVRDLFALDERFLSTAIGVSATTIQKYLNEPFGNKEFVSHLRNVQCSFQNTWTIGAEFYAKRILVQYAIVRACKPNILVETGVANGVSSTYLLEALNQNGQGELHSIEIGNSPYVPPGQSTGWIVPERLRSRWTLHLGDARRYLPELLDKLGTIDMFIHDSLHTYDHMKFEFEQAYPHLRSRGILISDDALWNSAFPEFVRTRGIRTARVIRGVGVLRKDSL